MKNKLAHGLTITTTCSNNNKAMWRNSGMYVLLQYYSIQSTDKCRPQLCTCMASALCLLAQLKLIPPHCRSYHPITVSDNQMFTFIVVDHFIPQTTFIFEIFNFYQDAPKSQLRMNLTARATQQKQSSNANFCE